MSERARSTIPNISCLRSQSFHDNSRDRVNRTASELHRQTVDRAHRRFEQQLADSEHQLRWAIRQRRDYSSSPAEKHQATRNIQQLRANLNNDYSQLIQAYVQDHKNKVDEVGKYINHSYDNEHKIERIEAPRKFREAVQESEKNRVESINQVIRERDAICEEKLAAQKNLYNRLLDEQARRLRSEQIYQPNSSTISDEHIHIAKLKGRLARVEYEHRELKRLVFNLRSDLTALVTQQPTYKSIINIPNFIVKP